MNDRTVPGAPRPGAATGRPDRLIAALRDLREAAVPVRLPLDLPDAAQARAGGTRLVGQLDDYLLPRLARLDAPLLTVVGGSTGAGKSTLVNSLVGAPVSPAGVLRPTTRSPVLASNPADTAWFAEPVLLPGLPRTQRGETDGAGLRLVAAPGLRPGLALLDAPDIDSVVTANRDLADQVLGAADLWLFLTTAARYADAVPWSVLRAARDRGAVVALVLNRVPGGAEDEIAEHLTRMLAAEKLATVPLFVLPEVPLGGTGLLPARLTDPLADWLARLAADERARAAVVRQTVGGAVAAAARAAAGLADAADAQIATADTLRAQVRRRYADAQATVTDATGDGTLLRGEVLARWQEFVGTGEFMRTLQGWIGGLRDRLATGLRGRPGVTSLRQTLATGLVDLIRETAAQAAQDSHADWSGTPAGAGLLRGAPGLDRPEADLADRTAALVADWQREVLELVRGQGARRRQVARIGSYAVNAGGLLVMIAVFASTAFIPTGLEVAVAGGTTVAGQRLVEAAFGDQAMRELARQARDDLVRRVGALLDQQAARYTDRLDRAGVPPVGGLPVRTAAQRVRREAGVLAPPAAAPPATPAAPDLRPAGATGPTTASATGPAGPTTARTGTAA